MFNLFKKKVVEEPTPEPKKWYLTIVLKEIGSIVLTSTLNDCPQDWLNFKHWFNKFHISPNYELTFYHGYFVVTRENIIFIKIEQK